MTLAIPAPNSRDEVKNLADQLRAHQLPPPARRRSIRLRAGWKLSQLADYLGVDPMSISRWERGLADPWPRNRTPYLLLLRALEEVVNEQEASDPRK